MTIKYAVPSDWIQYDKNSVLLELSEAKGSIMALKTIPYQRRWVDALQEIQLKLEVAGTSKIEGADFSGSELDVAMEETPEQLLTRSQKQAHAAVTTYRWIATIPNDRPINQELICEVHRRIITGADDDHCEPGRIRKRDQNVTFGSPIHRGADGGDHCEHAFDKLIDVFHHQFQEHDPLIQALAVHYHFAAMHPFADGNGRTARALEALMLQRAGLRDTLFIAMSNYYYDEKKAYLESLSAVRREGSHDLTPFIKFGLKGIALQSQRLANELRQQISKQLFRNLMHDLFTRLATPRRRVIAERQLKILELLLERSRLDFEEMIRLTTDSYKKVANPRKAIIRDLLHLSDLGAISIKREDLQSGTRILFSIRLEWPSEITESKFFEQVKNFPKSKTHSFL